MTIRVKTIDEHRRDVEGIIEAKLAAVQRQARREVIFGNDNLGDAERQTRISDRLWNWYQQVRFG